MLLTQLESTLWGDHLSRICIVAGNGLTLDLVNYLKMEDRLDVKNLFHRGDTVPWPDGSGELGFLSYHRCPNLWKLGVRPYLDAEDAYDLIEEILASANAMGRRQPKPTDSHYAKAYFELVQYIKHLFVFYNSQISDKQLTFKGKDTWRWLEFLQKASEKNIHVDIVTYCYDVFLERVLQANGIPFHVAGFDEGYDAMVDIFKPHGSISFCHKKQADRFGYLIPDSWGSLETPLEEFCISYEDLDANYAGSALIPPAGDSSSLNSTGWAREMRQRVDDATKQIDGDDTLIITGLSYWHVDRAELDSIFLNANHGCKVYLINPHPPKCLEAVLASQFERFSLHTSNEVLGAIL